ncbi:S1 family peptidase [Actinokineospora sp. NPDC004072]
MRSITRLAFVLALSASVVAAPAQAAEPDANIQIIGGRYAEPGEFPWMVRLSMGCGGVMLTDEVVLTAAHCFPGAPKGGSRHTSTTVLYGLIDLLDPQPVRRPTTYLYINPYYSKANAGDWALLKLHSPIAGAATVPIATTKAYDTGTFTIAGWGATVGGSQAPSRYLRKAEVPFISDADCAATGGIYASLVPEREICAGYDRGGPGPCYGDSGGPLLRRDGHGMWIHVGIFSRGEVCGKPAVYTELSTYGSLITRLAAELDGDTRTTRDLTTRSGPMLATG